MNKIILVGNLSKDAEIAYSLEGGKHCINISIACERTIKENGQWVKKAEFIPSTYYAKDTIMPMLMKGRLVSVVGYWKTNKWEDKVTQEKKSRSVCQIVELNIHNPKAVDPMLEGNAAPRKPQQTEQQYQQTSSVDQIANQAWGDQPPETGYGGLRY